MTLPFHGVIAREGVETVDGRILGRGSLRWDTPILLLDLDTRDPIGDLTRVWRDDDGTVWADGVATLPPGTYPVGVEVDSCRFDYPDRTNTVTFTTARLRRLVVYRNRAADPAWPDARITVADPHAPLTPDIQFAAALAYIALDGDRGRFAVLHTEISARAYLRHHGIDPTNRQRLITLAQPPIGHGQFVPTRSPGSATPDGDTTQGAPMPHLLGRPVWFRSRTGRWTAPAFVTATTRSLYRPNVDAGHLRPLTSDRHVHLIVLTAGLQGHVSDETRETHPELADPDRPNLPAGGTFQEFDVPEWQPEGAWQEGQFRFEEQPPGTWMWPL